MERQCWANNQYSRRECLEISGIPENIENKDLENLTLQIFEKIDISVDPENVEDCHWVKPQRLKKVIIKLSRRKDTNKICSEKKKLNGKNLTSLGINAPVYINGSLCIYYKKLWAKCKKLHNNKLIYAFWISNGSIKLKVSENVNIHVITHYVDLEELFPNNELIKDIQKGTGSVYLSWVCFSQLVYCVQCSTFTVQHLVIFDGIFMGCIRYFGVL